MTTERPLTLSSSPSTSAGPDVVGLAEVALRLGVKVETAQMWRFRRLMPPERWTVSDRPAWDWELDIVPWAKQTGRMPMMTTEDTTELARREAKR